MVEKIKRLLPLIVSMLILSSCATIDDPKMDLIIAQRSFTAVVDSLSELRASDAFEEDEIINITKLILSGDRLLDMWTEQVIKEEPFDAADVFYHVLGELIEYKNRGENDGL